MTGSQMLTLRIIGEPVAWSVPKIFRNGGTKKSDKLVSWQNIIYIVTEAWILETLPDHEPWDCPILMRKFIVRRTQPKSNRSPWPHTKPDIDNYLKAFLDAVEGLVYTNDSRIVHIISAQKIWATEEHPAGIEAQFEQFSE